MISSSLLVLITDFNGVCVLHFKNRLIFFSHIQSIIAYSVFIFV